MSTPLIWPTKTYFYPIGNTPAVCLTQDLPHGQSADVLLLGCGDARNVLYTVYADLPSPSGRRNLDITCCDYQPAILARNILLYVLIFEGEPIDKIWNIYYHFFIDEASSAILVNHCETLLAHSNSVVEWHESKYGSWLKVLDSLTLADIRTYWQSYVDFRSIDSGKNARMRKEFDKLAAPNRNGFNYGCARCTGPLMPQAMATMSELYRTFWKSGTTLLDPKEVQLAKLINPTFVYSLEGEKFEPHYGTFPLQSFHLAHAFAPIPSVSTPVGSEDRVIQTAKEQFAAWCGRFREMVGDREPPHIVIRFYGGDALSFSSGLLHYRHTGDALPPLYTAPWRGTVVHLDSIHSTASPTSFDVIDTSNLTDHLGLINILLVSVPLLKTDPDRNAILYTETLLPSGEDASRSFLERIGGDVQVMSVVIGLAPRPLLTGFQSTSHSHELMMHHAGECNTGQYHQRVSWVRPIDGDQSRGAPATLVLGSETSAHDLGTLLFSLYDNLLERNGVGEILRLRTLGTKQALIGNMRAMEEIRYNRGAVSRLFRLVRDRIEVSDIEWENAIGVFLMKIQTDSGRLTGMNYIQDLCLQLHIEGVHTTDVLRNDWTRGPGIRPVPSELFRGWSDIPPVVCVVLTVPRHAFRPFLEWKDDELFGSPVLHMQFDTQESHSNSFSSVYGVAGELDLSSEHPRIREMKPFFDAPSFVFSCWVPTWLLTFLGSRVSLTIQSTPRMAMNFVSQLGPMLTLYSTRVADTDSVRILRSRPGILSELDIASSGTKTLSSLSDSLSHRLRVDVNLSMSKIPTLTGRLDICDEAVKTALVGKAAVSSEQVGPCTMQVSIGVFKYIVTYPLAIIGEKSKLRIARKSGYVEIIVPPSGPLSPGGYLINPFPVVQRPRPTAWGLHAINLNLLPVLDIHNPARLEWINYHLALQMSDREREMRENETGGEDALMNVKDSIHSVFTSHAGVGLIKGHPRVFGLAESSRGGVHTLLFIDQLRLDLAAFTVVADVAVLPLDRDLMPQLERGIQALQNASRPCVTNTRGVEAETWRKLLPALVERCRMWDHKETCEYRNGTGGVKAPISSTLDEPCLCTCGRGVDLESFTNLKGLGGWELLRPFATRAALGPIFAASYVEPVGDALRNIAQEVKKAVDKKKPSLSDLDEGKCRSCGGSGKPTLLVCGRCKGAKYCSTTCQRADWKAHKKACQN
ncbi:hypothetical protein NEOLEDRAFT_1125105 [Neolentinus lepideus HHB14362 ss-1]|uniref:MYND-type domain-containing protein n=1 Tax=Neolentinus lepideus HHB14362 ss-1 TaxID=1314782 RepID=A0A165MSP4_9AGAM|nr:hypothetical protein NEOLEDRAFT_1125105 [Neolentinus lepideus HHB14362 ss-1]